MTRIAVLMAVSTGWACGPGARDHDPDAGADAGNDGDDCTDEDGDGAGVGPGCRTQDCDDTDPATIDQCGRGCDERPGRRGCPCEGDSHRACYHGPEGTSGAPPCRAGVQECVDGLLGPCEGQRFPNEEACDDVDNDCDGEVDDGVLGECGSCGRCESLCIGAEEGCTPWTEGEIYRLSATAEGWLTLERLTIDQHLLWPTTSLLKVDAETQTILGAYRRNPIENGPAHGSAVDRNGDAFVEHSRGIDVGLPEEGYVMKVAANEEGCIDRDHSGVIDTSRAWDDVLAFDAFDSWEDECIVWMTEVPDSNGLSLHEAVVGARVVTTLWVGVKLAAGGVDVQQNTGGLVELDTESGTRTGRELWMVGFWPQMLRHDGAGRIWLGNQGSELGMFEPDHLERGLRRFPSDESVNSIEVDERGFVWVSGGGAVHRFDPDSEEFEWVLDFHTLPSAELLRSGNLAADGEGSIWLIKLGRGAFWPHAVRIDTETLEVEVIDLEASPEMVAVDTNRHVWFLQTGPPSALVLDLATRALEPALADCLAAPNDVVVVPCIDPPGDGDISALRATVFQGDLGVSTHELTACREGEDVEWSRLRVRASIPAGSAITLWVKVGRDQAQRDAAEWISAGTVVDGESEVDLGRLVGVEPGRQRYFELQARLSAGPLAEFPVLRRVDVQHACIAQPQ